MRNTLVRASIISGLLLIATTGTARGQMTVRQVRSDTFEYLLLGYGLVQGNQTYGGPGMGLGFRTELDSVGLDVSVAFIACTGTRGLPSNDCTTSDLNPISLHANISGLYFVKPTVDAGLYVGAGVGWGSTAFSNYLVSSSTRWRGTGLQGKLTLGYEISEHRRKRARVFVQADAVLPFYRMGGESVVYSRTAPRGVTRTQRRYTPSFSVSVGVGGR